MTDRAIEYSETEPDSDERMAVLDALAGDRVWAFLTVDMRGYPELALKAEVSRGLDVTDLRALLEKTLAALP